MGRAGNSSQIAILNAAIRVVLRDGIRALTLDAVAAEARVSKGGILYHFGTKDLLLGGMVTHCIRRYEDEIQDRHDRDEGPPGRWMRAYLATIFAEPDDGPPGPPSGLTEGRSRRLLSAIVAAASLNPALLAPWREHVRRMQARFAEDGLDPLVQAVTSLAAAGFWAQDALGLLPPDDDLRDRAARALMGRAGRGRATPMPGDGNVRCLVEQT